MGHRLKQNDTNISEIYIGRPISTSDIRVPISDIRVPISNIRVPISNIRVPISNIRVPISDVQYLYPTSNIQYQTSARARARARARAGILDVGYTYQTSDIDIGRRIYILDI